MPTDKPTDKMPADKNARLTTHDAAKSEAERAEAEVRDLEARLEAAKAGHAQALVTVQETHAEAYAEELSEHAINVEVNDLNHKKECEKHCKGIESRRAARVSRGESAVAHDAITVVTIDDLVHTVVSAHGLFLGTHGFNLDRKRKAPADLSTPFAGDPMEAGDPPTHPGSRYKVACGFSVDAAHDELDHERFDQTKSPDCPACAKALAMMEAGEMKDARSDYLTSKEQIALARKENANRNKATSGGQPS